MWHKSNVTASFGLLCQIKLFEIWEDAVKMTALMILWGFMGNFYWMSRHNSVLLNSHSHMKVTFKTTTDVSSLIKQKMRRAKMIIYIDIILSKVYI